MPYHYQATANPKKDRKNANQARLKFSKSISDRLRPIAITPYKNAHPTHKQGHSLTIQSPTPNVKREKEKAHTKIWQETHSERQREIAQHSVEKAPMPRCIRTKRREGFRGCVVVGVRVSRKRWVEFCVGIMYPRYQNSDRSNAEGEAMHSLQHAASSQSTRITQGVVQ
ncbi:hypothetical protein VTL71DRAFT_10463 [Oculimacula yallundae]|uniref:Uncharacterized protein n=1 Tax=Oculimacula yallundae TaxID=86028 RepID=A0ABR4CTB6_9HELO